MSYSSHFPHSDSYRPQSQWVPAFAGLLWGAFLGLLLRFLLGVLIGWSIHFFAIDSADAAVPSKVQSSCQTQWKAPLLSAQGEISEFESSKRPFKFEVGRTVKGAPISARILQGTECLSFCRLANRIDREDGTWESLQFQCESTRFPALVSPVSLLRPVATNDAPVVRFGTWTGGYRDTPLRVSRDLFSPKLAP